jgi:hypothetical protein
LRIALVVENLVERAGLFVGAGIDISVLTEAVYEYSYAMTTPSRFWMMPTPTLQFSFWIIWDMEL